MQFVINQEVLRKELGFLQGVIEKKTTITALSNILLQTEDSNRIRMTGSNLEMTMHIYAPAKILKPGSALVAAKKLFDIAKLIDSSDVYFQIEENSWVRVECGKAKFRLACLSADEYPDVPTSAEANLELSSDSMLSFIHQTSFAVSQELSRYLLSAAKFLSVDENDNRKKLKMVTTDGHRLAMTEKILDIQNNQGILSKEGHLDILIPKHALHELARICRDTEKVEIGEDDRNLYFVCGNRTLIARKLTGIFPNYEAVIPKENPFRAEFEVATLRTALRRVSLMSDEVNHAVKITLKQNEALIESFSQDGQAQEIIPAIYNGDEFVIGFNSKYIQEFLDVVSSVFGNSTETIEEVEKEIESDKIKVRVHQKKGKISFEFHNSESQVLIRPLGIQDYNYIYVVMPLRL